MHIARAQPPAQHIDESAVYPGRHVVITGHRVSNSALAITIKRADASTSSVADRGMPVIKPISPTTSTAWTLPREIPPARTFNVPEIKIKKSGRFVLLVAQHPSRLKFDEIAHIYYGLHLVVGQSVEERYFIPHFANILDPDLHTHSPSLGQAPGPSGLLCYSPRMPTSRSNRIKDSARSRRAVAFSV